MSDESIGMMDKAYFVGKVVIMQWINELLGVSNQQISLIVSSSVSLRLKSAPPLPSTAA